MSFKGTCISILGFNISMREIFFYKKHYSQYNILRAVKAISSVNGQMYTYSYLYIHAAYSLLTFIS